MMRKYRLVSKKGEGTFSEVLKAQNVKDGKYHAIKCMKNRFDSIEQVNNLREIQALRRLTPHDNIITLEEVLYDQPTGRLALVFELMDANLYEMIKGRKHFLNPNLVKSYMWQLMKSLDHMHRKGIFHRDIKPENILIEKDVMNELGKGLKLADFGSCRGIYSKQPYTEYISTRWYRPPECLLTDGYYGPEMDLWGAGCVMFEITSLYPLFPGTNEIDQISRIHKILGTPKDDVLQKLKLRGAAHISFDFPPQRGVGIHQLISHASPDTIDLIDKLLKYDASERITAREALRHPFFKELREFEAKRVEIDTAIIEDEMVKKTGITEELSQMERTKSMDSDDSGNVSALTDGVSNSLPPIGPAVSAAPVALPTSSLPQKDTLKGLRDREMSCEPTGKANSATSLIGASAKASTVSNQNQGHANKKGAVISQIIKPKAANTQQFSAHPPAPTGQISSHSQLVSPGMRPVPLQNRKR